MQNILHINVLKLRQIKIQNTFLGLRQVGQTVYFSSTFTTHLMMYNFNCLKAYKMFYHPLCGSNGRSPPFCVEMI